MQVILFYLKIRCSGDGVLQPLQPRTGGGRPLRLVVGDALYGVGTQGVAWIDERGGKAVMRVQESLQ